mgnify:CR=1 FL=1
MNLFTRKVGCRNSILADDFTTSPETTFWTKWFGGCALPLGLAGYAVHCYVTKHAIMPGLTRLQFTYMHLYGSEAVFFGLALLSFACLLHFHYFWNAIEKLEPFSELLKNIALICLIGTFGMTIWLLCKTYFF